MSETDFLKLKKHDNVETNTEKFDIENYLNGNWDKINENAKKVNTDISNINSKNKEQDTNIKQLQGNTETSSNKIVELEKELKEMQEDFYQSSIRGQASGEYIHVEDSSNCRAKIGIGGNHEQETRSGKNKIEITKTTTTVNGCTHTIKDGTDTLSGTSSTNWANLIIYSFVGDGKTYTLSGSPSTSKNIFISAHDNVQKKDLATSKNGSTGTFVATSGNSIDIIICVAPNLTLANELFKPQLEEGSKATGCEQGGASPSPNYPSEVKCVGSNVNLFDKDDSIINGYYIDNTGNLIQANNSWYQNAFIKVNSNMQYTISSKIAVLRVCFYDSNKQFISRATTEENNLTFTTPNNCEHIKISGNNVAEQIAELKLEKGKVATPYSKYGQGCVKVTKCNKNILNIEDIDETEKNGIKYSVKNGVLKLNGTTTADFYIRLVSNIRMKKGKYIHSTNYIQSGLYISFDNLGNTMLSLQNGKKITFELTKDKIYSKYFIWIDKGIVLNNVEIKLQLEHSSTENSFEQHEEQTYIMPVQQEMLENDYLDYDNEEEVHVWGKKILTGDEGWRMPSSNDTNAVFTNLSNTDFCDFKSDTDVQYCNYFKYKGIAQGFAVALNKGVGIYSFYSVNKYEYFVAPKAIASSVNEWKVWLKSQYDAGTPVIIYYKLQTPTRLKFTDEQKAVAKELNNARTYKNVTNITTDSKAILSLDYAKDLETLLTSKESEV